MTRMLAHIEALEADIEVLSQRITELVEPWTGQLMILDSITGVGPRAAEVILAEIGPDMSRFPTAGHLASWAGMCPGHDESGGKGPPGGARKGSSWLRVTLTEAAYAAGRGTGTYLSDRYHRLIGRKGKKKTAIAVGRTILEVAHHLLSTGELYDDQRARPTPILLTEEQRLIRQLEKLGHRVILEPAA